MQRLHALKEVFSRRSSWVLLLSLWLILSLVFFRLSNYALIHGNMGSGIANTHLFVELLLAFLISVNITILIDKLRTAQQVSKSSVGAVSVASFLGVLLSGCASCAFTLASYIGLSAILTALPFFGIELKILGVLLSFYGIYASLGPTSCKLKPSIVPRKQNRNAD